MVEKENNHKGDAQRMLNMGVEVTLKKLGKVTVKELSLESIMKLAGDLPLILENVGFKPGATFEGMAPIANMLKNPNSAKVIRLVAAESTGRDADDFKDMGAKDWLKLFKAFMQVLDWEETKELFMEAMPEGWTENLGMLLAERQQQLQS